MNYYYILDVIGDGTEGNEYRPNITINFIGQLVGNVFVVAVKQEIEGMQQAERAEIEMLGIDFTELSEWDVK